MSHPADFRSPAYRSLVKALGESDAAVEWIEVGVREVQRIYKLEGPKAAEQLAARHDVHVNVIDLADLRTRCAHLQLLAVYQQAEQFFRLFRKTHPRNVTFSRDADEDVLTATLAAFDVNPSQVGHLECDVFQYYRLARNFIMHDPEGDQRKTHKKKCAELRVQVSESPYKMLDAPNFIEQSAFDDFVLFTRTLKQLAGNLCTATIPTDDELAALAMATPHLLSKLKSLHARPDRCENAVAGFLRERYSISAARATKIGQLVVTATR
jgi:hypothetical protein